MNEVTKTVELDSKATATPASRTERAAATAAPVHKGSWMSLGLKTVIILGCVVLGVTLVGGWSYHTISTSILNTNDYRHAVSIVDSLRMAAAQDLEGRRSLSLKRLVNDAILNDSVRYVAIVDAENRVTAMAAKEGPAPGLSTLMNTPVSIVNTTRSEEGMLLLARPILRNGSGNGSRIIGGVRLMMDTSSTSSALEAAQQKLIMTAAVAVVSALLAGYLMVWFVVVKPLHRIVTAARKVAAGDYTARLRVHGGDEIGELAFAFDAMVSDVSRARDELVGSKEHLEQCVLERTGQLEVANDRLRHEIAEKEDFLRAVSHDLNAPLRNIAGMATLITMKFGEELPEEVVARLQRIQANVDVQASMLNELLELSRVKTCPQKREKVDFGGLVSEVVQTFEYELKTHQIDLVVNGELPRLFVERNRIRQVFQNLIDNAIKYMDRPTGGRIEVLYEFSQDMHTFCISDNGPGISPEDQEKLFRVFRRVQSAATAKVPGKGVGLALIRNIVSNYDGKTWVESKPGVGSKFCFSLAAQNVGVENAVNATAKE